VDERGARDLAATIAAAAEQAFGINVRSVILHGSLTLGGYVPGRSDVDLLVVVQERLRDEEVAALVRALGECEARTRVDLRVATAAVAAAPVVAPPMEAFVELRPGAPPAAQLRHPGETDLLVEFSVCRQHGLALVGAPPLSVIGEVPLDRVLEVADGYLARWESLTTDAPHAELMVLTACRIWHLAETGKHSSKAEAGALGARSRSVAQSRGRRAPAESA
jgi:hypothetical protein